MNFAADCGRHSGRATPSLRDARNRYLGKQPVDDPLIFRRSLSRQTRTALALHDLGMESLNERADEAEWCATKRARVIEYLEREKLVRGQVGEWPAWHIYPYVAAWAIESVARPGWVGWWAISGDLPTDYTACGADRTPRGGVKDIAERWRDAAANWGEGRPVLDWSLGTLENQEALAPLLASRAELLLSWVADDTMWEK
jgi:hypothetical protein